MENGEWSQIRSGNGGLSGRTATLTVETGRVGGLRRAKVIFD